MFYVKTEINSITEIKIDITDENVFSTCPVCGTEHQVDLQELLKNGDCDLHSTSVFCPKCAEAWGATHITKTTNF